MDQLLEIPDMQEPVYRTPYTVDLFDMSDKTKLKSYVNTVASLPKPLHAIILDQKTARYLNENLGAKMKLSETQRLELTRIVRDILISAVYIGDLATDIQSRLKIDEVSARNVANALITELLQPVMADIKALQLAKFKDRISGQAMPTSSTTNNVLNLRGK